MKRTTHLPGEQLSAYSDGRLDIPQTRSAAEHLRGCPDCRQSLAGLEELRARLRALPPPAAPPSAFWNDACRRLRVEEQAHVSRPSPWAALRGFGRTTPRRWAAGLTAAALLVGAVLTAPSLAPLPGNLPQAGIIAAPQDDTPDVAALVQAHADSASQLPLADPDRQSMIAADARQAPDGAEAAANADGGL